MISEDVGGLSATLIGSYEAADLRDAATRLPRPTTTNLWPSSRKTQIVILGWVTSTMTLMIMRRPKLIGRPLFS
jgi:hypothetical protein